MSTAAPKRHAKQTLANIREKRLKRIPETFAFGVLLLAQDALNESRKPIERWLPVPYRHGIDDALQAKRLVRQIGELKACLRSDWNARHPLREFGTLGTRANCTQTRGPITGKMYWELHLVLFFDPMKAMLKTT